MREAVSSRRRGSMASEKCGLVTKRLHATPHAPPAEQGRGRAASPLPRNARSDAPVMLPYPAWWTDTTYSARPARLAGLAGLATCLPSRFPRPSRPSATSPTGRPIHLLPLLVMPYAARRTLFRSGTLPAHPWRASAPAARRQKAPGHHYPHHQNGNQYQNLPHGGLLLAYVCRSGRVMPAISGASKSLRPPLPDGNSVRTHPCMSPGKRTPPSPLTPARQHAIPLYTPNERPTLASEPLRKRNRAVRKGLFTLRRFRSPARKTSLFAKGAYSSVRDRSKRRRLTPPEGERTQCE